MSETTKPPETHRPTPYEHETTMTDREIPAANEQDLRHPLEQWWQWSEESVDISHPASVATIIRLAAHYKREAERLAVELKEAEEAHDAEARIWVDNMNDEGAAGHRAGRKQGLEEAADIIRSKRAANSDTLIWAEAVAEIRSRIESTHKEAGES